MSVTSRFARSGNKKGNVMTPLNWMCGITETLLVPYASYNVDNWLGFACFKLAIGVFTFYALVYVFFAILDPDRLQTEQFNLEARELKLHSGSQIQIIQSDIEVTGSSHSVETLSD